MEQTELNGLKKAELEILLEIDRICKKHKLSYFLTAGTLIGAVRHKGFIPWDDDIDISMPVDDYIKFCKICKEELGKDYFLQNFETDSVTHWFAKIRKNNTTCIEKGMKTMTYHQGIWVDIFPQISIPDGEKELNEFLKKAICFRRVLLKHIIPKRKYFPKKLINKYCWHKYTSLFADNSDLAYCDNLWPTTDLKPRFKREWVNDTVEVSFEGYSMPAPIGYHEILTKLYGDYMTPPPPEKRNGGEHTIEIVDTEKNYTEYTNKTE